MAAIENQLTDEQRSKAWFAERAGRMTASKFKAVLSAKSSETYLTYLAELAIERLTGAQDEVTAKSLAWGKDHEAEALNQYVFMCDDEVTETGFHVHPEFDFVGGSPDGFVGDGGLEIKCPKNSAIHVKAILRDEMPSDHMPQVQGNMWVTNKPWWDFISYDPRMPSQSQLFIKRVFRDQAYIDGLQVACIELEVKVKALVKKLTVGQYVNANDDASPVKQVITAQQVIAQAIESKGYSISAIEPMSTFGCQLADITEDQLPEHLLLISQWPQAQTTEQDLL